jgi:hypothetical protein
LEDDVDVQRSRDPMDRMTRLCDAMVTALTEHPEYPAGKVQAIVFIQGDGRGGIELHNYDDDVEAIENLIIHLKALFKANGMTLAVAPLNQG